MLYCPRSASRKTILRVHVARIRAIGVYFRMTSIGDFNLCHARRPKVKLSLKTAAIDKKKKTTGKNAIRRHGHGELRRIKGYHLE